MTDTKKDNLGEESAIEIETDTNVVKKSNFQKYAENNSVGGLSFVLAGSSKIRRLLWLLILLCCVATSLFLLRNSVSKLITRPTATTINNEPNLDLDFPAVTICNLNWFSRRLVNDPVSSLTLQGIYTGSCSLAVERYPSPNSPIGSLIDQDARSFIQACIVGGSSGCTEVDFDVSISRLGVCYTFNSGKNGKPILKANGTGFNEGLQLLVNVREDDYVGSFGHIVGTKVTVHPQSEPPLADEKGVYIAPGTGAAIGFRKRILDDQTRRHCGDTPYANCVHDQFYERLRSNCSCFSDVTDPESADRALNVCPVSRFCCYMWRFFDELKTPCLPQCRSTEYEIVSMSYARWPSAYFSSLLSNVNPQLYDYDYMRNNWLFLDIFYSSLTVQTQKTAYTYGLEEFFAEVGGQLGLCIGVSVISLFEVIIFVLDEIKDRCCKPLCCKTKKAKGISVI